MDIENIKAVIEAVKKRMKSDYCVTPHVSRILDDTCDTIIQQLEITNSILEGQNVLQGPIMMTDEQVKRLMGVRHAE